MTEPLLLKHCAEFYRNKKCDISTQRVNNWEYQKINILKSANQQITKLNLAINCQLSKCIYP